MFERLKERFSRKHSDELEFDDVRTGVLGRSDFQEPMPLTKGLDDFNTEPRAPVRAPDALATGYRDARYGEPIAMDTNFGGADRVGDRGRDFDIIDRLNLIESQLAAIRSQTETINERLKNLEVKLGYGRRY